MERRVSPPRRLALALAAGLLASSPAARAGGHAAASEHRDLAPDAGANPAPAPDYVRSERTYAVPDVTLVDAAGRAVRLRDALSADEPVMLNFIFTSCTAICPILSGIFARVPRELGDDAGKVRLISISIDPEQDTPQRLLAYARRFGAGPRWTFLTGSVDDILAVERAFDAYRGDKMNHQPLTLLRPAPGKPWVRLDGFASPAELAREYERVAAR